LGIFPEWCSTSCPIRMSKRAGLAENLPLPTVYTARILIGILTGSKQECGPQSNGTSPTLGWSVIAVKLSRRGRGSVGCCCGGTSDKNMSKWTSKHHFLIACQRFKRFVRRFCRNVFIYKSNTKEVCPEFDVKVGKVNFYLAWYN
jgi:hypothetical protein